MGLVTVDPAGNCVTVGVGVVVVGGANGCVGVEGEDFSLSWR